MSLRRLTVLASLTALGLAGCAAQSNESACRSFETLNNTFASNEMSSTVSDSERLDFRAEFRSEVDKVSLTASGDVKERLVNLVNDLPPNAVDLLLGGYSEPSEMMAKYLAQAEQVANACSAEGIELELMPVR